MSQKTFLCGLIICFETGKKEIQKYDLKHSSHVERANSEATFYKRILVCCHFLMCIVEQINTIEHSRKPMLKNSVDFISSSDLD